MANDSLTERVSGPFMEMLVSVLTVWFDDRFREEVIIRFNVEKPRSGQTVDMEMVKGDLGEGAEVVEARVGRDSNHSLADVGRRVTPTQR